MIRAAALALGALVLSGCFPVPYLAQAAAGQYELIHRARPLEDAIADPSVPPATRALLAKVPAIKRFGRIQGLTPTENYRDYVDLHRSAAVYVVQACAPLAFEPKRWTFPIAGSVPYLGFFDEAEARAFAHELEQREPLDVTVRTAAAYSTLGWFRDAVLSTMIPEGPLAFGELVNVILHESVHATVYVPDQTAFNESLASFIADDLTWTLLVGRGGLDSPEAKAWRQAEERGERFMIELRRAHDDLEGIYRSNASDDEKRTQKSERLDLLQHTLGLRRRYNNADLAGIRSYDTGHDAFAALRRACGSWPAVFNAVRTLQSADFDTPHQTDFVPVVNRLLERQCRGALAK